MELNSHLNHSAAEQSANHSEEASVSLQSLGAPLPNEESEISNTVLDTSKAQQEVDDARGDSFSPGAPELASPQGLHVEEGIVADNALDNQSIVETSQYSVGRSEDKGTAVLGDTPGTPQDNTVEVAPEVVTAADKPEQEVASPGGLIDAGADLAGGNTVSSSLFASASTATSASSATADAATNPFDWESEIASGNVWTYVDPYKKPCHQVAYRDTEQGKQIFERHIVRIGSEEWSDDMSGFQRGPFRVDAVKRARTLVFVESESVAKLLNSKLNTAKLSSRIVATTVVGGLGRAHDTPIAPYTFNKLVVVLPTNDAVGVDSAHELCRICEPKAAMQRIVALPNRTPGGGVKDFIDAGGTVDELVQWIEETLDWSSTSPPGSDSPEASVEIGADNCSAEPPRVSPHAGAPARPEDVVVTTQGDAEVAPDLPRRLSADDFLRLVGDDESDSTESDDDESDDDESSDGTTNSRVGGTPAPPAPPARVPVNFATIPSELRDCNHWVLWRYEWSGSKYTKVPYQPSGYHARTNQCRDWISFGAAREAYLNGGRDGLPFDGVGFVLTRELGLVGVDIDKQRVEDDAVANGGWLPEAVEIVQSLGSYTEVSPSGRGLRVFLKGVLPASGRKRGPFEIYDSGRYLTITGQVFPDTPAGINENQEAIDNFHARFIAAPARALEYQHSPAFLFSPLSNEQVLQRARAAKNGAKFCALYDQGDLSGNGGDHSAADSALCAMLAYWTGRNARQMDALFRGSRLMRPKWDEVRYSNKDTYGQRAIAFAVENCEKVCDPRTPQFALPDVNDIPPAPLNGDKVVSYGPRQILQLLYGDWSVAAPDTEVAHAHRIAHYFAGELVFVNELGWLRFNGRSYVRDDRSPACTLASLARLSRYVRLEAKHLFAIANLLESAKREDDAKAMRQSASYHNRHASRVEARRFIEDSLLFAAGHPALRAHVDEFNIRPWVVGFLNGVWDRGVWRAHQSQDRFLDLCPISVEVDWLENSASSADSDSAAGTISRGDDEASHEWNMVLSRISGGDKDLERTLQDVAAYALSGASHMRIIPWAYGGKGTGKSTFTELLQTVLGKSSSAISPDKLSPHFDRSRLGALLWNRRAAVCAESGNKQLDAELLKTLSGADTMGVRYLYKEAFDAAPRHTLILVSNHPPRLEAYDEALKDRILALPFTHALDKGGELTLSGGRRIEDVRKQVDSPLVRGFARWALRGLASIHESGEIFRAQKVIEASERFWRDTDPLGDFWECIPLENLHKGIYGYKLRATYKEWCEGVGISRTFGPVAFKRACESIGLQERRFTRQNVRGWQLPDDPNRICERLEVDPATGRQEMVQLNVYGMPVVTGDLSGSQQTTETDPPTALDVRDFTGRGTKGR